MTRTWRVESKRELEAELDDFITRGYVIKQQGEYSARVKKRTWGDLTTHAFIAFLVFLASAIVADAADLSGGVVWLAVAVAVASYAAYSRISAEEIDIRIEHDGGRDDGDDARVRSAGERVTDPERGHRTDERRSGDEPDRPGSDDRSRTQEGWR